MSPLASQSNPSTALPTLAKQCLMHKNGKNIINGMTALFVCPNIVKKKEKKRRKINSFKTFLRFLRF